MAHDRIFVGHTLPIFEINGATSHSPPPISKPVYQLIPLFVALCIATSV